MAEKGNNTGGGKEAQAKELVANALGALKEGKHDEAIENLNKAIELTPNNAGAYRVRGLARHMRGDYDKAVSDLSQAIEMDPKDAPAHGMRGNAYRERKEYDKAIADLSRAIELVGDDFYVRSSRGIAYSEKGEYDKAIADLSRAIELKPDDVALADIAPVYGLRGVSYYEKGEYDKAIENYSKVIELVPDSVEAYINRGSAHGEKREYDKAIEDYDKAIELKPDLLEAYRNRVSVATQKEAQKSARQTQKSYDKNLQDEILHIGNRAIIAKIQEKDKEYTDAIDKLTKGIRLTWVFLFVLALVIILAGVFITIWFAPLLFAPFVLLKVLLPPLHKDLEDKRKRRLQFESFKADNFRAGIRAEQQAWLAAQKDRGDREAEADSDNKDA